MSTYWTDYDQSEIKYYSIMHLKKFNGDFYSMRMLFLEENWFLRMLIYMQILCVTESVQYFAIAIGSKLIMIHQIDN
jgi:hypothetical protein